MDNLRTIALEELAAPAKGALATGPFGSSVSSKNFRSSGVPMLRGGNLSEDIGTRLDEADLVFLDDQLASGFARSTARRGDLVFTCWGTIGQIGLIDANAKYEKYVVSNKQMKISPDPNKVDSLFLYYYLSQPKMVDLVISQAIGSSVPGFNLGQLRALQVKIPDLATQRLIAEALGALDDKIVVNGQLVIKSAMLATTTFEQAVHPSPIERTISEVTKLVSRGVTPTYSDSCDAVTVLNQKCIRNQEIFLGPARKTLRVRARDEKMLAPNDVLINSTGVGTLGRVARWTYTHEATVDSHISIVRFDEGAVDPICGGYGVLRLQPLIEQMGEGSTGQTELSRVELAKLRVRLPDRGIQLELGRRLEMLSKLQEAQRNQSQVLAAMRDVLLPQLMSGKIRVKDAEKTVEEVL